MSSGRLLHQCFAKLINEDAQSSESTKEYSQTIIDESDMLMNRSSNLLRLSELDSQVIHAQTTFSLDEQIRQVILLLHPTWDAKLIDSDLDLASVEYLGDEELLRQVWLNLIQNAIKFSNEGGTIRISL
ncbi:MAG: sensor histidine kinase, partial [Sporomusa sp.]